jgi:hypothetical protein
MVSGTQTVKIKSIIMLQLCAHAVTHMKKPLHMCFLAMQTRQLTIHSRKTVFHTNAYKNKNTSNPAGTYHVRAAPSVGVRSSNTVS